MNLEITHQRHRATERRKNFINKEGREINERYEYKNKIIFRIYVILMIKLKFEYLIGYFLLI